MHKLFTLITFSITIVGDSSRTLELRKESHNISLQYSKYLDFQIKYLNRIGVELYHKKNQEYFHISDYSKEFPLLNITEIKLIDEIINEKNKVVRLLLLLDSLQNLLLKAVNYHGLQSTLFEEAYIKTQNHLLNGENLEEFYDFLTKNY